MTHKDTILYAHGSAYNHGCEAIVRSTQKILKLNKENTMLYSNTIDGDLEFELNDIVTVKSIAETPVPHNSPLGIAYRALSHLHSDHEKYYYRYFGNRRFSYMYDFGEVAFSIGGDNYCYESALSDLQVRNYWLNKKGFKTVLWGASLEESLIDSDVIEDFSRYSLITVRETTSLELLKKYGVKTEILCAPDPAFALDITETPWPDGGFHNNVIGINISHFATTDIGMKNYIELVKWILSETDCEIAFIPHVVFPNDDNNNDIVTINQLLSCLPKNERIFVVDGQYNCCQLKSLISRCKFFIGARTHATIAAYSTCVPTLVVGYSSKSIGIARDLFGKEDGYVCSVQKMQNEYELLNAFKKQFVRESELKTYLRNTMPAYVAQHDALIDAANSIIRK